MSVYPTRALAGALLGLLPLAVLGACGDGDTFEPPGQPRLAFTVGELSLDTARAATVTVRNEGDAAVGPVSLSADQVRDAAGTAVPGVVVLLTPSQIPTLAAGDARAVQVTVQLPEDVSPGGYTTRITAESPQLEAEVGVTLRVPEPPSDAVGVRIVGAPAAIRQGDVVTLAAEARDSAGAVVENPRLTWSVLPADAGLITADGRLVGYVPGAVRIIAAATQGADTVEVELGPRGLSGSFSLVGHGAVTDRFTSDLWLHGQHAYTGTWSTRASPGNTLYAWSIASPSSPVRTDSVRVDAGTVNDVKVSADGRLAVITHEGGDPAAPNGGITLLDLADPAHPRTITRFTQGLEPGVHNVWIEGSYVYVVVDGGVGLRIVDISTPSQPRVVASFHAGTSFLHDVYVRNGLAFLSHWDAGLVILDVGNGVAGGSPTAPIEVSRIANLGGQTHNAWYWPAAGYVFLGEEDYSTPGIMHVVDVRDLTQPREVATYGVPGDAPHNFWLDESSGVLYLAWYSNGLRALDVSGELMGDLTRQGREIAVALYGSAGPCPAANDPTVTCTWAPQLHQGHVWVSDMNGGLFSFVPSF